MHLFPAKHARYDFHFPAAILRHIYFDCPAPACGEEAIVPPEQPFMGQRAL